MFAVRLEVAILQHQPGRGAAVVVDVTHEAARRLLDAHALTHFARARFQHLDADAVFLLESLDDGLVERRAEGGRVDDELALLLRRLDHLLPIGVGLGHRGLDGKQRRERYEFPSEHRRRLPVVLSVFKSVLSRFLMSGAAPAEQQHQRQHEQADDADLLGLPPAHISALDRQHLGARRRRAGRGAELAHDAEEDEHPGDCESRPGERDQDAPQRLPPAGTVDARAFFDVVGRSARRRSSTRTATGVPSAI